MGLLDKLRGTEGKVPAKSIVAAAMPMEGPGVTRINRGRHHQTQEQWQKEAWRYFDVVGELRAPLVWIANAVSQADLHATTIDPDTGKPTGPSDDPRSQSVASQAFGGPQKRAGLLRTIALCWQVAGEAWVVIRPRPNLRGRPQPDEWLVLSGQKVTAKGESWQYTDPFTQEEITLSGARGDRLIRIWCPHPNDQGKADSSVRPALVILREIEKASQNIASRLDSRLAMNGVWLVPEEIDYPRGDFDTSGLALMDMMLTAAETSLQNPGQAAAAVPIVLTVPGEQIQNSIHLDFATEFDAGVVELRDNGRERLASTLDMPKQVAAGDQGEGNHWSDWKVEEDTYKIFIEPLLKAIADPVSTEWMTPALIAMGMSPEEAAREELAWDTTAIVARPDATETLRDLHDRNLISDEYMLAESGIPEDAKPGEEERQRRFLERVVIGAPTLLSDPSVAEALGLDIEVQPLAAGVDATVTPGGELEAPEPPPTPLRGLPSQSSSADGPEALPAGLTAAAQVLVMQALDRAGGRLLTNQNRGQYKDTPRHELYRHIRPTEVDSLVEVKFADDLARSFAVRPGALRASLEMYVTKLLLTGDAVDLEELRWYLR